MHFDHRIKHMRGERLGIGYVQQRRSGWAASVNKLGTPSQAAAASAPGQVVLVAP